jgi:hypothetical protein
MKVNTQKQAQVHALNKQLVSLLFCGPMRVADKNEYVKNNLVFKIVHLMRKEGSIESADHWVVTVQPDDGRPPEVIALRCNPQRDEELWIAEDYVNDKGPMANIRLVKSGKTYYFLKPRARSK